MYKVRQTSQWLTAYLGHRLVVLHTAPDGTKGVVLNFTVTHSTEIVLGQEYMWGGSLGPQAGQTQTGGRGGGQGETKVNASQEAAAVWQHKAEVRRTFSPLGFETGTVPIGK